MDEDHAPTPYTADQIREQCRDGYVVRHRIEQGGKTSVSTTRFEKGDLEGCTVVHEERSLDGTLLRSTEQRDFWKDMRAHASFKSANTTIESWLGDTWLGPRYGWLYTVRDADNPASVQRFVFLHDLAGPPVEMVVEMDGRVVYRMTAIDPTAAQ